MPASTKIMNELESKQLDMDKLASVAQQFAAGTNLGEMRGLSDKDMEAIYSVGFNLYNAARYDEALKVFKFLCLHSHMQSKYWMGLGATQQMLKQFKPAASTYAYAYILDCDNPKIPLHAADCFLADGNYTDAESALNLVLELAKGNEKHKPLRDRAEVLLQVVQQKKGNK